MVHPALQDMNYDELTSIITDATKLRAEKFESNPKELEKKLREKENMIEAERLEGAVPPNTN